MSLGAASRRTSKLGSTHTVDRLECVRACRFENKATPRMYMQMIAPTRSCRRGRRGSQLDLSAAAGGGVRDVTRCPSPYTRAAVVENNTVCWTKKNPALPPRSRSRTARFVRVPEGRGQDGEGARGWVGAHAALRQPRRRRPRLLQSVP